MLDLSGWQKGSGVLESTSDLFPDSVIPLPLGFHLRPPSIHQESASVSQVMATRIHPTFLLWYAAPKCAWRKRALSIVPCAKHMELESARSKRSGRPLGRRMVKGRPASF